MDSTQVQKNFKLLMVILTLLYCLIAIVPVYNAHPYVLMNLSVKGAFAEDRDAFPFPFRNELATWRFSSERNQNILVQDETFVLSHLWIANDFSADWKDLDEVTVNKIKQMSNIVLENGYDIEKKDTYGCTAYDIAIFYKNTKMQEFLISKGASTNTKDCTLPTVK